MKKLKKMIVAVITMVMMSTSFTGLAIQASAENTTEAIAVPTSVPTATPITTVIPTQAATTEPTTEPTIEPTTEPTQTPIATKEPTADEKLYAEIRSIADKTNVGEKDETFTDNINVYMDWGTVGPLYSLLNIYQDLDNATKEGKEPTKTFMWYERPSTIDYKKLPEHVVLMNEIDPYYDAAGHNAENTKKCMGFLMKVYETYPNAHYTFYTDDLRSSYEFLMMNYNGITNYDIVIESDGTASYTYVKSNLYPNVDASNTEEALKAVKTSLADKDFRYSSFKNQMKNKHVQDAFLSNNGAASDCMWSLGKQDNAQYWLQWPELVGSAVSGLNDYLTNDYGVNFVKKVHNEMYASLTEDSKKAFMNAVLSAAMGSDYSEDTDFKALYDNTYFPGYADGSKKYMIISGTSPSGEGSSAAFEERVNNVMNYFGDEYVYLYKPHPRWAASKVDGRVAFLESKGIKELPAQTPMETILWAYPNVSVGGYSSSLYMSATTKGQVKFFFAANGNSLGTPLPDLYNLGYFDDAIFFNPDVVTKFDVTAIGKYADKVKVQKELKNDKMTFTITSVDNSDLPEVTLYTAEYDENGKLLGVKLNNGEVADGTLTITSDFPETSNYKFMLWDDTKCPLTNTITTVN